MSFVQPMPMRARQAVYAALVGAVPFAERLGGQAQPCPMCLTRLGAANARHEGIEEALARDPVARLVWRHLATTCELGGEAGK